MQSSAFYEVRVDGADGVVLNALSLFEAWSESAPEGVAAALDLSPGATAVVCELPRVEVRRVV